MQVATSGLSKCCVSPQEAASAAASAVLRRLRQSGVEILPPGAVCLRAMPWSSASSAAARCGGQHPKSAPAVPDDGITPEASPPDGASAADGSAAEPTGRSDAAPDGRCDVAAVGSSTGVAAGRSVDGTATGPACGSAPSRADVASGGRSDAASSPSRVARCAVSADVVFALCKWRDELARSLDEGEDCLCTKELRLALSPGIESTSVDRYACFFGVF
jgi:hypothetical protein